MPTLNKQTYFFVNHDIADSSSVKIFTRYPALRKSVVIKSWEVSSGLTRNAERESWGKPKSDISPVAKL